jgi:DNA-binding PadR family transcriptional regulator
VGLDLNPSEWAVLGVVAERQTHGFALAQVLGRDGPIGRVWTVPRPVVYQVIKKLESLKLIAGRKTEPGDRGPQRTVYGVTPAGRRALEAWMVEPVEHVREVRSLLMLKLALLDRAGTDPRELAAAQAAKAQEQLASLARASEQATGFDRVILEWRLAGTRATLDFLSQVVTN